MVGDPDTGVVQVGPLSLRLPAAMAGGARQQAGPGGEAQHLRLEHTDLEAVLEISLEPAAAVSDGGLRGRLPSLLEMMQARGVELQKVRSRQRRAGHLDGEEVVLRVSQGTRAHLLCLWAGAAPEVSEEAAGQPSAGPCRMVVQMTVPEPHVEQGLVLWDEALNSAGPAERTR